MPYPMDLNPHCKPYKVVPPGEKLFKKLKPPVSIYNYHHQPYCHLIFSRSKKTKSNLLPATKCQPPKDGTEDSRITPKDLVSPQIAISRGLMGMVMVMAGDDFHGCPKIWITVGDPKWLVGNHLIYDWCLFIFFVLDFRRKVLSVFLLFFVMRFNDS